MIDPNLILNNFEHTAERLQTKGVDLEMLRETRHLLEVRKGLQTELDNSRARLNRLSEEVGTLMRSGETAQAGDLREEASVVKDRVASLETDLAEAMDRQNDMLLRIPNLPAEDCPVGYSEDENVVLRIHGYDSEDYTGTRFRPHWEVASELGIFDAERAAKISGSLFSLLRNKGAQLLRALISLGLDLNRPRYEEIIPPHFVRSETFTATGHLPKFEFDAYKIEGDDLWAIPTGEVPLMSLHRDEIIPADELPKRYMAYTVCFRREAGSAGKDTRGMQRLHEFHKVELLKLCRPDQVQQEFDAMLADAERPLQVLGLPYRVVDLCTSDLTFSSARVFDLEVYAPGVDRWLEVSSVGIFTDFQARRGNIRYRNPGEKPEFVHALNGSAMATPRVWAAVVEHGQQPDGTIKLPRVLADRLGYDRIGRAEAP